MRYGLTSQSTRTVASVASRRVQRPVTSTVRSQKLPSRPAAITVLCIVLTVIGVLSVFGGVYALIQTPSLLRAWSLLSGSAFLFSIWGLWKMKKWAPVLFLAITAINMTLVYGVQITDVPSGARSWLSWLLPVTYFTVVMSYWRRLGS